MERKEGFTILIIITFLVAHSIRVTKLMEGGDGYLIFKQTYTCNQNLLNQYVQGARGWQ